MRRGPLSCLLRKCGATPDVQVSLTALPSKRLGLFAADGTLIVRSDSNGEDLEAFAGAGVLRASPLHHNSLRPPRLQTCMPGGPCVARHVLHKRKATVTTLRIPGHRAARPAAGAAKPPCLGQWHGRHSMMTTWL